MINCCRCELITIVSVLTVIFVCAYGNVSEYGEECNHTAECIDHRMICSTDKNNISVCKCDRFHEWRGNLTGCAEKYNVSTILKMVVFFRDPSVYERNLERIFLGQLVAGFFVLSVCGITSLAVMLYCFYIKKTDKALKESIDRMKNAMKSKASTTSIRIRHI